jgi:hypothetical protein
VAGNHRGDGTRTPAGLPLQARGLTRSVASALTEANLALAGTPGWQPLPARLGGLRLPVEHDQDAAPDPVPPPTATPATAATAAGQDAR